MTARLLSCVLLCCFLLAFSPTCYAAELLPAEQTRLETIFQQLQANYQIQLEIYAALKTDLTTNEQKLREYQAALEKSQTRLAEIEQQLRRVNLDLETANASLKKASESLKQYEKEKEAQIKGLERKNKLLEIIAGAAVIWAATK